MSLLKELQAVSGLTEREHDLRDFLLAHPERVYALSARELAEQTFTSAATVTRFCKKFGCKGYPDFKVRFLSELNAEPTHSTRRVQISERENLVSIVQKATELERNALEETHRELSLEQLIRVQELLRRADYIDFYAYDTNVHLARYGCSLLFHAGKIANTYSESNVQVLNALHDGERHLSILISHTGENAKLVALARALRRKKSKIIVITGGRDRTLSGLGDEFLFAASTKTVDELWSPMFFTSAKYLLDMMFSMAFSSQYAENMALNSRYEKIGKSTFWTLLHDV